MGDFSAPLSSRLLRVVQVLALASLAAWGWQELGGDVWRPGVLAWTVLVAIGSRFRVPTVSGPRFTLAVPLLFGLPLLYGDEVSVWPAPIAVIVGCGFLLSELVGMRLDDDRGEAAGTRLRQALGGLVYAVALSAILEAFATSGIGARLDGYAPHTGRLVAVALAGLVWFAFDNTIWAVMARKPATLGLRYLWLLAWGDWAVAVTLLASGALFAFGYPVLGPWSLLVAGVPYAFSHTSFFRYQEARDTYAQTIRALARIPEVGGLASSGHADRVASLAVAVGQELGLNPQEVQKLHLAALMHDIGRISLNEPNVIQRGFTDEDIARWSAEIIAESSFLHDVAEIVRRHHQPFRRPGERFDDTLPLPSRILKAASAYDHAIHELGFSTLEALETLHRAVSYDYDPDVVAAIRTVLERRGIVPPRERVDA